MKSIVADRNRKKQGKAMEAAFSEKGRLKRFAAAAVCLALALVFCVPAGWAENDGGKTVVRVGWYDSPFNRMDQSGRRSGYAYEYQQKIAAFTDWEYEYVEGTWPVLLQMLLAGEIDMLSDVSYTEERAGSLLYPSLPMGSESYYIYTSVNNLHIKPEDLNTFNGMRIGVYEGSIQADIFVEWAARNNIQAQLLPLLVTEEESIRMLETGEVDAYITIDTYESDGRCVQVCKIGSSDFYFALSGSRSDLLPGLNDALNRIQNEDRYYNQQMFDKYIRTGTSTAFLTSAETAFLAEHGPIRVGYREDYLPFCGTDTVTGEFTGALQAFFEHANTAAANAQLTFEAVPFANTADALKALKNGEVDCVFPVNISAYEGENMGLTATTPLIRAEMYAVVSSKDRKINAEQTEEKKTIVAVNANNVSYDVFLQEHFPFWTIQHFNGTAECFKAVRSGEADVGLISSYRIARTEALRDELGLSIVATGSVMNLSFALNRGSGTLYGILNKVIGLVPTEAIDSALAAASYPQAAEGVMSFVKENSASIIFVITAVFIAVIALLMQSLKNARRANEGEHLISMTEMDPLTALYNKGFFFEYAGRMYRENPDRRMDAITLDVEQFHSINALNGREFGDFVLRLLGGEIRSFLAEREGIATRFDGDRFDIYCDHLENHQTLFDQLQNKLNELPQKANVRLCMGVMPATAGMGPEEQFDHAWSACNMARKGQQRLMVYNQQMREQELLEQRLLRDLHRAVADREFEVYYQPKYDVRGDKPVLRSAEALVRWRHPELGLLSPDKFIPLLERDGQINVVDHYVWDEAARQIARWKEQYGVTVPISVNLSRLDVFDPELESVLGDLVNKNGLHRNDLRLEVTESAYTDNAGQLVKLIERLREGGFAVEMDDFGTGYSSLNMLTTMPIDVLKMDRAFIQNMENDDKGMHLVQLILDIAKTLKVPVVAEGVETEGQANLLKELGCALVQGYYFSHPMPPEQFGKAILGEQAAT